MGYLRALDYQLLIQTSELNQMTTSTPAVLSMAESMAIEEMISYLKQRYDVNAEFQPTTPWDPTVAYDVAALVEINFQTYSATSIYPINATVIQNGIGYICISAIVSPETFNPAHWTAIGNQYDLYYAKTPKPEFDYKHYYKVGDQVFWKNNTYTCLVESKVPDHLTLINYDSYAVIPYINIFPDDPDNGVTYWGEPTVYVVTPGTLPTNTSAWTKGDNRSQLAVFNCVHISLYNLSKRVAPQNVPANRLKSYKEALNWLMAVSQGDLNAELPELQPNTGNPIIWGGSVKRNNKW